MTLGSHEAISTRKYPISQLNKPSKSQFKPPMINNQKVSLYMRHPLSFYRRLRQAARQLLNVSIPFLPLARVRPVQNQKKTARLCMMQRRALGFGTTCLPVRQAGGRPRTDSRRPTCRRPSTDAARAPSGACRGRARGGGRGDPATRSRDRRRRSRARARTRAASPGRWRRRPVAPGASLRGDRELRIP